jgi:hypothetical protein
LVLGTNTITTFQYAGDYNVTTGYIEGATCSYTINNPTDFITLRRVTDNVVIAYGISPVNITYTAAMGNIEMHVNSNPSCGLENANRTSTIVMSLIDDYAFKGGNDDGFTTIILNKINITDDNAFKGGNDDGFTTIILNKINITDDNAFKGGNDDGFATIILNKINITDPIAFTGGIGRGETQLKLAATSCNGVNTRIWNGSVSTAWENPSNWDCGIIPIISSEVIIPNGVPNYPVVNFNNEIKKLTLSPNASITIMPAINFKLNGL